MKLSTPIYRFKRQAKQLSRAANIPLNNALDTLAAKHGYASWSQLSSQAASRTAAEKIFSWLHPGDMMILGARPGHGKTMFALEILSCAVIHGQQSVFFTLEYNRQEVDRRLLDLTGSANATGSIVIDQSDDINAEHIKGVLDSMPGQVIVVIDYLQLLDQKRSNPDLSAQVIALKDYASHLGTIFVFLSQIDRSFELSTKTCPSLGDVRLPNPIDLTVFNKACFLNNGVVETFDTGSGIG